jgi:hypothetical protein
MEVLLLGSSHGRGLSDHLHSVIGPEYAITNIFKPNAALHNVVVDLETLSKDMMKDDHVIIKGGPDNSLDMDSNYQIEKDFNNTANDSINTNVGFVGLLERHDKPRTSRWVRGANMVLEHALWTADRSHIGLTGLSSINRYDHTRRGLYLNSRGKESLYISLMTVLRMVQNLVGFL